MTDPRFPTRPDHPDFWLLSQIVIDNDATQDNATQPFDDRVSAVVDPRSVSYVAVERTKHLMRHLRARPSYRGLTNDVRAELQAAMAAVWLDAFLAGAHYQAAKQQPPFKVGE